MTEGKASREDQLVRETRELVELLRLYLSRGSIDGRIDRQPMRRALAQKLDEIEPLITTEESP